MHSLLRSSNSNTVVDVILLVRVRGRLILIYIRIYCCVKKGNRINSAVLYSAVVKRTRSAVGKSTQSVVQLHSVQSHQVRAVLLYSTVHHYKSRVRFRVITQQQSISIVQYIIRRLSKQQFKSSKKNTNPPSPSQKINLFEFDESAN